MSGVMVSGGGDIGAGVTVTVCSSPIASACGVHSMVTVKLSLPVTTLTTLTASGAGAMIDIIKV